MTIRRSPPSPKRQAILIILIGMILAAGCSNVPPAISLSVPKNTITSTSTVVPPSATPTLTQTATLVPPTSTTTATPSATPFPEPAECRKPPEDYEIVSLDDYLLNRRTIAMLEYAQSLYGGEIQLTGSAITQGSFHDNGAASFGTHLGGGAVDLSVIRPGTWTVLYDDIPPLLDALRVAGFAAWLREVDEVFPGSGIHIHAVAIGDVTLSEAAKAQLDGPAGYFRGYSGLPPVNGIPTLDRFGGPVLCNWMRGLGYSDLRNSPTP